MKTFIASAAGLLLCAPALAQYTAQVVGIAPGNMQTSALTLNPGQTFSGAVVLTGPTGVRNDSAVFRLVFSDPGLLFTTNWYQWSAPYVTGGLDDLTTPSASSSGAITPITFLDAAHPGETDVGFENVTPNFGDFFLTGELVHFTLQVPANSTATVITISFADGSFTNGAHGVDVASGELLTLTVVPAPAPVALCVLGLAWSAGRSKRCSR